MKKYIFISIVSFALFITSMHDIYAAEVSFGTPKDATQKKYVDIVVNANTDGILVNSAELVIDYDETILTFAGYSDENAVIKLWIDPPREDGGKIYLSGIVPGGVLGLYDPKEKNLLPIPLVHLLFTPKKTGEAQFTFTSSKILKYDGKGTPLPHQEVSKGVAVTYSGTPEEDRDINTHVEVPDTATGFISGTALRLILFIAFIFFICGVLIYKLLKYRHDR